MPRHCGRISLPACRTTWCRRRSWRWIGYRSRPTASSTARRCRRRTSPRRRCRGPRTPQEELLCALFAEVLGLERVGIDDNFFALGGDSIMSIQLVSRARKAGLIITPRAVFQHQTIAALAGVADLRRCDRRHRARPRHRRLAGDADHALAGRAWRADRALQPGDAAAGAGGAAGGAPDCSPAGGARSSRCVAAAAGPGPPGTARGAWRWRPPARCRAAGCIRRIDIAGLADDARRACISEQAQAAERQACAGGRGDGAGGVVRCRRRGCRPAAADHPSSGGRRGVVAHPAAGPCGGLGGDRDAPRSRRCRRGAPRSGAGRNGLRSRRKMRGASASFRSGAGC